MAEDNTSNQRAPLEMLKKMGYRADAVADGKEVLQALERQPYDLDPHGHRDAHHGRPQIR